MTTMTNWLNFRAGNDAPPATFTQEQVNTMMAEHKKGMQTQIATLQTALDEAKKAGGQTAALQAKVDELSKTLMTKEEAATLEVKKTQEVYQQQLEQANGQSKHFRDLYSNTLMTNELISAATAGDAFNPEQLVTFLSGVTKVKEVTDNAGQGTGQYKVVVQVGEHELTAADAVTKMREDRKFGNLFKVKGTAGAGAQTLNLTTGATGTGEISSDINTYMANRENYKKEGKL